MDDLVRGSSFFVGCAKVNLSSLHLEDDSVSGGRAFDERIVSRLVYAFGSEGCKRLSPENYITAVIDDDALNESVRLSGIARTTLYATTEAPVLLQLTSHRHVRVLHGKHRVKAAERFLDTFDQWWIANLYRSELPEEEAVSFRNTCPNTWKFADGDVFRYFRASQLARDDAKAGFWKARLGARQVQDINYLYKSQPNVGKAFDELLQFPLWTSLCRSHFQLLSRINCEEEVARYLKRMCTIWLYIAGGLQDGRIIDHCTVEGLQHLSPSQSACDRDNVERKMEQGLIFAKLDGPIARAAVLERIMEVQGRILSLATFLEDLTYFGSCAKILRKLIPKAPGSLERGLIKHIQAHRLRQGSRIEIREGEWMDVVSTPHDAARLAYIQLVLFTQRNFPWMVSTSPRKDAGRDKVHYPQREDMWPNLGRLAAWLGFSTGSIAALEEQDPIEKDLLAYMRRSRPADEYIYDDTANEALRSFADILRNMRRKPTPTMAPHMVMAPTKSYRCGRPTDSAFRRDRCSLYLGEMFLRDRKEMTPELSSLDVAIDIFRTFLGDFDLRSLLGANDASHPSLSSRAQTRFGFISASEPRVPLTNIWRTRSGTSLVENSSQSDHGDDTLSDLDHSPQADLCQTMSPAIYTIPTYEFEQLQDLKTWLDSTPQSSRTPLYYHLNTGIVNILGEDGMGRNFDVLSNHILQRTRYVCGLGEHGPVFVGPAEIMRTREHSLLFFGEKGLQLAVTKVYEQIKHLVSVYYPSINSSRAVLQITGRSMPA